MAKKKPEIKYTASREDQIANPESCLNLAADDEPIFVLRANDELAPDVVRAWAERYHASRGRGMSQDRRQLDKYISAYQIARDMEIWKKGLDLPLPEVTDEDDGA